MSRLLSRSKIQEEVKRVLRLCKIESPPVPVEYIAKRLGAEIQYEPFEDDISGVLYRDKASTIIGVSSLHHPNRQRFTIAHEIAHLVLHELDVHVDKGYRIAWRDGKSSQAADPAEIDANRFAAELLMPEHFISRDVRLHLKDIEDGTDLAELAKAYRVSTQAMAFRLANLSLFA